MKSITFLGPVGTTFSTIAYERLAKEYHLPSITNGNCIPATTNSEIIDLVIQHGGYGAIAMETAAGGRVAEALESFIKLLDYTETHTPCPLRILGAIKMKLHFCLMTKSPHTISDVSAVIAHPKALDACKKNIQKLNLPSHSSTSNGEAARCVAEDETCSHYAAIGPVSAAEYYHLAVLNESFEDKDAYTTFFLLGQNNQEATIGAANRALIIFTLMHEPGSLVQALLPFQKAQLNLIQIHSMYSDTNEYRFAIEIEVASVQITSFNDVLTDFKKHVAHHIFFGPFEIRNI
ncbi:MAG: P-protein [Candidatus Parcubacteria bacterium]|jgi:prephenate dehydratase